MTISDLYQQIRKIFDQPDRHLTFNGQVITVKGDRRLTITERNHFDNSHLSRLDQAPRYLVVEAQARSSGINCNDLCALDKVRKCCSGVLDQQYYGRIVKDLSKFFEIRQVDLEYGLNLTLSRGLRVRRHKKFGDLYFIFKDHVIQRSSMLTGKPLIDKIVSCITLVPELKDRFLAQEQFSLSELGTELLSLVVSLVNQQTDILFSRTDW